MKYYRPRSIIVDGRPFVKNLSTNFAFAAKISIDRLDRETEIRPADFSRPISSGLQIVIRRQALQVLFFVRIGVFTGDWAGR